MKYIINENTFIADLIHENDLVKEWKSKPFN